MPRGENERREERKKKRLSLACAMKEEKKKEKEETGRGWKWFRQMDVQKEAQLEASPSNVNMQLIKKRCRENVNI